MLVHFSGISQVASFIASADLPAGFIQGGHRSGVAAFFRRGERLPEPIVSARRSGLPLNEHRGGDQHHKKARQQYRGHQPLANTELVEIEHIGRLLVAAGAECSQSPMTAGEARGDMEDIVTRRRITRLVETYLSGWIEQGCNPIPA
ncbi:hypothetical protein [Bradyrhizobium sp. Leo170]|uniref:hypothetical protein n=1 Tax=Bradyrhizobium sp. Leo170 TaxID=1571199 RepID=UPI0013EE5B3C|nr:hypothetical protein [Bradyrhizobium sp. Leo170]